MLTYARFSFDIARSAASEWMEHKAAQLGASLAFYCVLSMAPLLVIALATAALVFDRNAATDSLMSQVESMVGSEGAKAIQGMIEHAQQPETGLLATILGLATLFFGASGVFGQLQDAMNTIWEAKPRPRSGIWQIVRTRFLSFTMVLGTGFLLLISLILSATIAVAGSYLGTWWPGIEPLIHIGNELVTIAIVTLLFAMIFKLLPDTPVAWRDVWMGALVTAILFALGKILIGLYLGKSAVGSAYGAAGSFVVLLVWVYYSAQILLFGAELTQVYSKRCRGLGVQECAEKKAVGV